MNNQSLRFSALIVRHGSRCWAVLPDELPQSWGEKPHYYLAGEIAGCPFRGRAERKERELVLPIGATWLKDNGIEPNQSVEFYLRLEGPLLDELATDIREAIQADSDAQEFFESIAPFYRKGYLRWIESARTPNTRAKRIAETVQCLHNRQLQR
ncbi:MAG: YdeI/OmpD-associated family protein [Fimbriimonadales bacterium]|nr:YdeI/OmpD-associated family protein [Fimbriimonadales bacterium]